MRIDTFCGETDWTTLAAHARRAEAIGFDGFAIPEITGDPFIHAAIACNATERIQARTAIAVALLGGLRPWGVVVAAILFGALEAGASSMQREAAVPAVWVDVITALVILAVVAFNRRWRRG